MSGDQANANPPEDAAPEVLPAGGGPAPAAARGLRGWAEVAARLVARLWVVGLLLAAAIVSGASWMAVWQAERRLERLRAEPGPDAYAVVAYRRELERQIAAMRGSRAGEATPAPPARPRLLEDIDIARARNRAVAQETEAQRAQRVSRGERPGPTTPVVRAPE